MKKCIVRVQLKKADSRNLYDFASYEECALGDLVIVETRFGNCLGTVVDIVDEDIAFAPFDELAEVICKVDTSAYDKRKQAYQKREDLKRKMDIRLSQLQNEAAYALFAQQDPEMAELYKEYKDVASD